MTAAVREAISRKEGAENRRLNQRVVKGRKEAACNFARTWVAADRFESIAIHKGDEHQVESD
jgi:hypothetical protein